jgi:hypothetical protein
MTDIGIDAPTAPPLGLEQRLPSASQLPSPRSYLHNQHCFAPGVTPALLARPESHSP